MQLQTAASDEQIEAMFCRARENLGCELPVEYVRFLKRMNGLSSNGLVIYATDLTPIAGYSDRFIGGLVEENIAWRDNPQVSFGEGDVSRYVLTCQNSRYQVLDYQSDTLIEEVGGFDHLLYTALREHRPEPD